MKLPKVYRVILIGLAYSVTAQADRVTKVDVQDFLQTMDAVIDSPRTMVAARKADTGLGVKFQLLKGALNNNDQRVEADKWYRVVYCRIHRDRNEGEDTQKVVNQCERDGVSNDIVAAKTKLAAIFAPLAFKKNNLPADARPSAKLPPPIVGTDPMQPSSPTTKKVDKDDEYWWIRYVVVPITVALIALLPVFLTRKDKGKTPTGKIDQRGAEVKQSIKEGHNVNNVIGNVTINNPVKDKDSP